MILVPDFVETWTSFILWIRFHGTGVESVRSLLTSLQDGVLCRIWGLVVSQRNSWNFRRISLWSKLLVIFRSNLLTRFFKGQLMKMLTPWARTFHWWGPVIGCLPWQFPRRVLLQHDPTCSFEWEGSFPKCWGSKLNRWEISPVSSQMRDFLFGYLPRPWYSMSPQPFSIFPSTEPQPAHDFCQSLAPSSWDFFTETWTVKLQKLLPHQLRSALVTASYNYYNWCPILLHPWAMFGLASWHCAARLPSMWQRSGRCLCCRLVDRVDIVFLPSEFDQSGAFSSRQEQFPAQKP